MGFLSVVIIPLVWVMVTPVYGQEFAFSRVLFLFLFPGVMFWGVFILLASDVEGRGLPWRISAVSMISAFVMISLDLVLIPRFNSVGAAIASSITHGMSMILAARLYYRITGINPVQVFVPKLEDIRLIFNSVNNLIISAKRTLAKSSTG
jgi:O-antigen/teichoic acid export membrane protein